MKALIFEWIVCLKTYVRICFFIDSPSSLAVRLNCIPLSLLAYYIAGIFWLGDRQGAAIVFAQITIEVGILYAFSYLILKLRNKPERFLQTFSALIGSSLIISLVSMPVLTMLPEVNEGSQISGFTLQVNLMLLFWNLAVISLIFKRAFEVSTISAGFIAFNFFLLFELILLNVFK